MWCGRFAVRDLTSGVGIRDLGFGFRVSGFQVDVGVPTREGLQGYLARK